MDVRLINVVEVLKEELETNGLPVPVDLTDEQLISMTEADVRSYYGHQPPAPTGQQPPHPPDLQHLRGRFPSQSSSAEFKAWFPALTSSRASQLAPEHPKAVVLCFHSSGNAEDMFTSEGTGSR